MRATLTSAYRACLSEHHFILVDHELTSEPDPQIYCLCGRTQRRMYDWLFFQDNLLIGGVPETTWSRCAHNQPMEMDITDQCAACAKLCKEKKHLWDFGSVTHTPEVICRAILVKKSRMNQST